MTAMSPWMKPLTRALAAAGIVALASVLAAGPAAGPAAALTFEPSPGGEVIRAHGPIVPEDAETLKQLLDTDARYRFGLPPDGVTLSLHSPGGAVVGGIELANLVRARRLMTHVDSNSGCFSACTFVFIGGVRRTMEGRFGIHAMSKSTGQAIVVYSDTDLDAVQMLTSTLINLAESLIGDARMISAMLTVPGASIRLVSDDLLAEWRIITHASRPTQRMKASFDCSGSSLADVQRVICNHLQLADADRRVTTAYQWLVENKAVEGIENDQSRWQSYRDSCRHVPGPTPEFGLLSCINEAYAIRLRQLEGLKTFHEATAGGPASGGWKEHAPVSDILMIKR